MVVAVAVAMAVAAKEEVAENTFDPSTQKTEAGGSLSLGPAWSTEQAPGSLSCIVRP